MFSNGCFGGAFPPVGFGDCWTGGAGLRGDFVRPGLVWLYGGGTVLAGLVRDWI